MTTFTSQFSQARPLIQVLVSDQNWRGLVQSLTLALAGVQRNMYTLDAMARPLTMFASNCGLVPTWYAQGMNMQKHYSAIFGIDYTYADGQLDPATRQVTPAARDAAPSSSSRSPMLAITWYSRASRA